MEGGASYLIGCNYFDDGLELIESRTYTWLDERIFKDNVSRGIPCIKGLAHTGQVQLRDSAGLWIRMRMFHMPFLNVRSTDAASNWHQRDRGVYASVYPSDASHPVTDSLPAGSRSKAQHEVPYRAAAADIVGHSMSDESGVGSGSESSSVIGGLDTFKVHMDTALPTLQIERCRHSFSNTTGMNVGDKFNDILPESHRVMFTSWIKEMFTRSDSR